MNEQNSTDDPVSAKTEPHTAPADTAQPHHSTHEKPKNFGKLMLGCIGVVYGDIGTSPLYALRESLHGAGWDGKDGSAVL